MGYRGDELVTGEIYHIYTRGIEQRTIYRNDSDRKRFILLMLHCMRMENSSYSIDIKAGYTPSLPPSGKGFVDLLCYSLMSNHVHFLIKQNFDGGISLYMQRLLKSYAKYFNMTQGRSGGLFVSPFKSSLVVNDEQLLHVSRYIHINAYVAHMVENLSDYRWCSLNEYIAKVEPARCHIQLLQSLMNYEQYKEFVYDQADYLRSIVDYQHLMLE